MGSDSNKSREQVWGVFAEAIALFDQKNQDYGDAWRKNGWRGNLPRVFEKSDRVKELLWRSDPRVPAVGDESAVNTLVDMLNSIAFAIINLREQVEYGHEIPLSERRAAQEGLASWALGPDSALTTHTPTTIIVPDHLLSDPRGFQPVHLTPLDEGDPNGYRPDQPSAADNPQA